MKKKIIVAALALFLFPLVTYASSNPYYVNENGVGMTENNYMALVKTHDEQYAALISQGQYNKFASNNIIADDVESVVKYIKTEHNKLTGAINHFEITKTEYDAVNSNEIQSRATYIETAYKQIQMSFYQIGDSDVGYVSSLAYWKILPSTRSFDVSAMRLSGVDDIDGSQAGSQIYVLDDEGIQINYAWNGTNISRQSRGFGISMNLVNSNISSLTLYIEANVFLDGPICRAWTTYQHAVNDVTLAVSKSYEINAGGLGSVLVYSGNYGYNYDDMPGLEDVFII